MTTRVAVLGATGYTGAELLRLLLQHPEVRVTEIVGQSKSGQRVSAVLPALAGLVSGEVASYDAARIAKNADVAFACLPHGASGKIVAELHAAGLPVLDLSADFRLRDPKVHAEWYGHDEAPALRAEAVYGLAELNREALRSARLVAVPGCYPTASSLPLVPLLEAGLLEDGPIVIDAKSGVSGAGRQPGERTHFAETTEGFRAYKTGGSHRHTPEIEQTLSGVAGREIRVSFVPHLVPMTRGILASSYVRPRAGLDAAKATELARARYEGSPSVHVLDAGSCPDTLWVRGSNRAHLSYTLDARTGWLHCQGAIDNLVKGASGQAVQCFNLMRGYSEGMGLLGAAMWP
ncbi:MAG: N-acetyl-gamma-glutamyl-phosphate reductase [Sandaracinaceae bacterium]|nr:N-acetyl-gamma-glutamyl-phosphate reductase [Sandaracinaceae bacterium]